MNLAANSGLCHEGHEWVTGRRPGNPWTRGPRAPTGSIYPQKLWSPLEVSSEDEIRALEERLRLGDLSPDPDTSAIFDELLADDVIFLQPAGFSNAKSAVLSGHRPPKKRTFSKVENSEVTIRDFGNAVAVSCRTDFTIGNRSFAFRVARLWIKRQGEWKVAIVMQTEVPER